MATSFSFDNDKACTKSSNIFFTNFAASKSDKNMTVETIHNNMAKAIHRSLEQSSGINLINSRQEEIDSRRSLTIEPKSKNTNFSIRSLLDQDLKSPSDSGYGSGSPSPNESVFGAETPTSADEKTDDNFSVGSFTPDKGKCKRFVGSSDVSNPSKPNFFPSELLSTNPLFSLKYQSLLYAMNAHFLERQKVHVEVSKSDSNPPLNPENILTETRSVDQHLKANNELQNYLSSRNKINSTKTKQEKTKCGDNTSSFRPFGSDASPKTPSFPVTFARDGIKQPITHKNSLHPTIALSKNYAESCHSQNDYLLQMRKIWLESVTNGNRLQQFQNRQVFNPTYLHRLQMFLAAASSSGRMIGHPAEPMNKPSEKPSQHISRHSPETTLKGAMEGEKLNTFSQHVTTWLYSNYN